ncbi:MAG TPA: thioesterase family protein [Solirubrobacteraceae bacterium]|jgi:acyl-CoA thioesterase FadM|nr:thioesterase family protein [Solirubrobacteraceae bacterium]
MSLDAPLSPASIRIRQRVEWLDTDAAGIYHWSTIIRFAEAAEAALHNALGIAGETFGFTPRVSVRFDFRRPLRFNDEASVVLAVADVGRSSVRYTLLVTDIADHPVAEGEFVTVFIDGQGGRSRPWPEHLRSALAGGGSQTR